MSSQLRIGIPVIGGNHWLGGVTYVESLVRALRSLPESAQPRVDLIARPHDLPSLPLHLPFIDKFNGICFVGNGCESIPSVSPDIEIQRYPTEQELIRHIDFYYPVLADVRDDLCSASWIADFQHVHLPEFFSAEEIENRNQAFARVAEKAAHVVFSSRDAEQDFHQLFPKSRAQTRVLHFHTPLQEEWTAGNPDAAANHYKLPDRFLICCNQFWSHKNHLLLFQALSRLRDRGIVIPLVCTGSTEDYRHPGYFTIVQKAVADLNLNRQLFILGSIPRKDQIQLLRRSAALVQPSLFEGWSTVVEDGRALGKPMLLSDLNVHREQNPSHTRFFSRNDPEDLASQLKAIWSETTAEPDLKLELEARAQSEQNIIRFGRELLQLAEEAAGLSQNRHQIHPQSFPHRLLDRTLD